METKAEQTYKNNQLSNAIETTLETEKLFKLFSYRIIDQQAFTNFIDEVIKTHVQKAQILSKEYAKTQSNKTKEIEKELETVK